MRLQATITGAEAAQILLRRFRWGIDLLGLKDGTNTTFQTPEIFMQQGTVVIQVYWNGQRLRLGSTNDYTVAESGGVGTGFDTIIMAIAPRNTDVLLADYIVP
jgi:hypothetical protein